MRLEKIKEHLENKTYEENDLKQEISWKKSELEQLKKRIQNKK